MQPKQFNMLALGAVISLIAAGVVHGSYNHWDDETASGKRLFPGLETGGDKASKISIQKGEAKLTLKKSADGKMWSLVERSGYPVDAAKVRKLVLSLSQAELIERKTKNKELYGQLDLGDPAAKDSSAKLVRLEDDGNQKIAEVIIGKERRAAFGAGKSGTYLRMPGEAQTWLAKLELDAPTDVGDWVKPVFFKIDDQKMASLVMKKGDTVVYQLGRAEKKKKDQKIAGFKLTDVPAGKKAKEKLRINDLINGIRTLEMTDVRAATDADAKPDEIVEITMDDGAKYRVGLKRQDKERWITVAVMANGKDEAAAKKMTEATKGWAFKIADWRANQTFKKPDEVFETVKAEAPKMSVPSKANMAAPVRKAEPETTESAKQPEPANADVTKN